MPDDTKLVDPPKTETKTETTKVDANKVDTKTDGAGSGTVDTKTDSAPDAEALKAQIAGLEAALAQANKVAGEQSTTLQGQLSALQAEAVAARRSEALGKIGLPAEYHDVAPKGDPKDPAVATALEQWAAAHPLLLKSRSPQGPQVDLAELAKKLPGGGKGMTNMANMQANMEAMRRGY